MNNNALGRRFEITFCGMLSDYGFWVHRLNANSAGQPADVIAVRDGKAYLIDCKVCTNGVFRTSRVESNQHTAMALWESCGNGQGWFAMLFPEEESNIVMVPYINIKAADPVGYLSYSDIMRYGYGKPLDAWAESTKVRKVKWKLP